MTEEFEPNIIVFTCNWCSYAGADLAGVSRFQYPSNVRIIKLMCSGRVDPIFVLEAFRNGVDGVLVTGCHIGDCHYVSGNRYTEHRISLIKKIMEVTGLNPERLKLEWVSASEGEKFARIIAEMVNRTKKIGKNPLRG
ncbi:MAG: hydrogenase iron-sulfur subunit [Candidatus Bathyarchaeia archaeon]